MLRMVFVGTCCGIVIPGIREELVGSESPITSVIDTISVVSVLFLFGFKVTEVNCIWGWKTKLVIWFQFLAITFLVIVENWTYLINILTNVSICSDCSCDHISKNSNYEIIWVLVCSKLVYLECFFPVIINNGGKSCSVKWFEKFSK